MLAALTIPTVAAAESTCSIEKPCGYTELFMGRPVVNPFMQPEVTVIGNQVKVSWLMTKFAYSKILISDTPVTLTLDAYQQLTDTTNLAGYDSEVLGDGFWTYPTVNTTLKTGTHYIRVAGYIGLYQFFGPEVKVVVQ